MSISAPNPDVVIIGAGPYGLSLAAHLRARGVNFRIFGIPMGFWRDLPAGINLKSPASSTNISVPKTPVTFSEWCRERGLEDYEPCSMESFANYGLWIQAHFVPNVELTKVTAIARTDRGFDITLDDGSELSAPHVIVATGLSYLDAIPAAFRELPQEISK
ncbi:MAG: FAD/NAD(P)-binding protein, partial [Hyphomicrobium denitrificans]|nr:FAD/NAD(P)-binding protein [Hyphomicrobium denitrificans]